LNFNENVIIEGMGFIYSTNDSKPVKLAQRPPSAENVLITPVGPTAAATITANYDYKDINREPESGTILSWFKNNKQLFEIQGKKYWTNEDLLGVNKLEPNDAIKFSVTPKDGKDFGETVFSPDEKIVARPPVITELRIIAKRNDAINTVVDSGSTLIAQYIFSSLDIGLQAVENETLIQWFVNGNLFKTTTFSKGDNIDEKKSLLTTDTSEFDGSKAHLIGNEIYVEVTPKTVAILGETVRSSTEVVRNSIPIVSSAQLTPLSPTIASELQVSFILDDPDIALNAQTDNTVIKWLKSNNGIDFAEVPSLESLKKVPGSNFQVGNHVRVDIIPSDGLDTGLPVSSNVAIIGA